jgi:hypothetical protein
MKITETVFVKIKAVSVMGAHDILFILPDNFLARTRNKVTL